MVEVEMEVSVELQLGMEGAVGGEDGGCSWGWRALLEVECGGWI